MNEIPNESWISAYLDGELNADERQQFDRWLSDNPAAHELMDELRALSQTLQTLPREELGTDFATRVLQRAERAVLLPEGDTAGGSASQPHGGAAPVPPAGMDWARWSRPLFWSVLATAAGLMIVVSAPRPHDELAQVTASAPADLADRAPAGGEGLFASDSDLPDRRFAKESQGGAGVNLNRHEHVADESDLANGAVNQPQESRNSGIAAKPGLMFSTDEQVGREPLAENLVVLCEVTPQAVEQGYFAQVLTRNQVTVEGPSPTESQVAAKGGAPRRPANQLGESRDSSAIGAGGGDSTQTVYLVEASQEQLANVLSQLQQDHLAVLAVNVDPAPQIPAQQELATYSRDDVSEPSDPFDEPPAVDSVQLGLSPAAPAQSLREMQEVTDNPPPPAAIADAPQPDEMGRKREVQLEQGAANGYQYFGQNQLRRQIPVPEQNALSVEFENLTALKAAASDAGSDSAADFDANGRVAGRVDRGRVDQKQQAAPAKSDQRFAQPRSQQQSLNANARARQVDLPQFGRIDTIRQLVEKGDQVAQDGMISRAAAGQQAADPLPGEESGGGSSPKQGYAAPPAIQRSRNNVAKSSRGATSESAVQSTPRPRAATTDLYSGRAEQSPAVQVFADEAPLVKAVFVIQARAEPAEPPARNHALPNAPPSDASP